MWRGKQLCLRLARALPPSARCALLGFLGFFDWQYYQHQRGLLDGRTRDDYIQLWDVLDLLTPVGVETLGEKMAVIRRPPGDSHVPYSAPGTWPGPDRTGNHKVYGPCLNDHSLSKVMWPKVLGRSHGQGVWPIPGSETALKHQVSHHLDPGFLRVS